MRYIVLGLVMLGLTGCSKSIDKTLLTGKWQAMLPFTGELGYSLDFHQDGTLLFYGNSDFKSPADEMRVWRLTGDALEIQDQNGWKTWPFVWVDKNHMDVLGTHYERVE